MSLTRTLIRHAPTDYCSLFVRGLPASLDADDVRRYFCDRGYKCTVSFNKVNNEYYKLYVALQFDTEKVAREVYNKYDNEQVLGYNVGLSFYKDKARLYGREYSDRDSRSRKARVGQPVDKRRFNRTPSPPSPRSSRRRRSHSRSRRSRSRSRHSDSDRSRSRSHSHSRSRSRSSTPKRRNRSSSRERKKSRTRSFSRSPSRHSWSPKNSRARSKSPKHSDSSKQRKSLSPSGSPRKRHSSRHSLSPSHGGTKKDTSKQGSVSPVRKSRAKSPKHRSSRKRTSSQNSSSSSSSSDGGESPRETKRKSSPSPSKSHSVPSPTRSRESSRSRDDSPVKKSKRTSAERTLPDDQESHDHDDKEDEDQDYLHSSLRPRKKRKDSHRKSEMSDGGSASPECKSEVPAKATALSSSIYGKVASFTDMKIQQVPGTKSDKSDGNVPNGRSTKPAADAEDVEADLRAEFLNNNDALYDSHERMHAAGFPLVTRKKAEEILDDLPIDPLKDGHQYVSSTVERDFALSNGDEGVRSGTSSSSNNTKDVWTPEMLNKLKVKKEEIIQAYKQDCDTFTTVVKMLISKDQELEKRLQHALRENLKEIGQRCVEELHQLADKLKMETK